MHEPSPAFRSFMLDALRAHVRRGQQQGFTPDALLRQELSEFGAWLALGSWADLGGPEGTAHDSTACNGNGGAMDEVGRPAAVGLTDAARLLGVSAKTVQRLTAAGHLPSTKVGRRRVVARADIDTYLRGSHA